jgi:uncharacterized alpha-E superfamily protein
MLSRVADSLYWMSRYLERAERTARLIDVNLALALEGASTDQGQRWERVCDALPVRIAEVPADSAQLAYMLALDPTVAESMLSSVSRARDNARQVREQISAEMWEQINRLYWQVKQAAESNGGLRRESDDLFRLVSDGVYMFQGLADATMSHEEGWHYIQLGRFIERASATALVLDIHARAFPDAASGPIRPAEVGDWVTLLHVCTAFEAYCRRHTAALDARRIIEFILLDASFPRSIRFAVEQVEASLRVLTRLSGRTAGGRPERLAGRLRATLNYAVVDEIVAESLHQFLHGVRKSCGQVHTATNQAFISYQVSTVLT